MKKIWTIISAALLIVLPAMAAVADESPFSGEIRLTGKLASVSGNEAKFNEYRDIGDGGLFSRLRLKYDSGAYFMQFRASDMFYDTQSYRLDGGMWGKFKYNLTYNEIIHNFTDDAKTFYSGAGTSELTFSSATAPTNPATWTNFFDYSIERRQYGAGVTIELLKPFYLDLSASREEREGLKASSAARGSSPGGGMVEFPEPVDYATNNFKADLGYSRGPVFVSLSYLYSQFDNADANLYFRWPNTSGSTVSRDAYTLPPDNEYQKFAFKSRVKLPLNSALNLNAAYSSVTSDVNVLTTLVNNSGLVDTVKNLTDTSFDGKVTTENYAVVLTSNPVSFLSGKVYYKYYDKDNKSDEITGGASSTIGGTVTTTTNHLFEYRKNMFGAEVAVKLPAKFTLKPFYRYQKINRNREDIPETKDNVYGADLTWAGLDFLTAEVGYERLERRADYELAFGAGTSGPYSIAFDGAPQNRDTYKAGVELYPLDALSIGLGYKYKKATYIDTTYGLLDEKSEEYSVNADYLIGKLMMLTGYFDYEVYKQSQAASPSGSTADLLGWTQKQKDTTYNYGVGTEIYIIPNRLTLKAQYDYVRSNGLSDITAYASALPAGYNNDLIDIDNWDDYRKEAVMVKAIFNASKKLAFTVGYAYEKFKYSDAQIDNYAYVPQTNSFLTGAYAAPSYKANILFFGVGYRF